MERAHSDHSLRAAEARAARARPGAPPTPGLATQLRSCDLGILGPSFLPPTRPAHSPGWAGPGPCPGRRGSLWRLRPRDGIGRGWGCPPYWDCVPGLPTGDRGGRGETPPSPPHSPRPPPLPFPAAAAMNSRCGGSARPRALGTAGEARGVPLSASPPHSPPALPLPGSSRENLRERDVTRLRETTVFTLKQLSSIEDVLLGHPWDSGVGEPGIPLLYSTRRHQSPRVSTQQNGTKRLLQVPPANQVPTMCHALAQRQE